MVLWRPLRPSRTIPKKDVLFIIGDWNERVGSQEIPGWIQFSHSVMSNSLWPHGLQHARLPYPSLTPGVYSNSCPLSQWCHPTISFSVIPFSSHLQSFSIRVLSNKLVLHIRWPDYWSFNFSISPSNEYSELISFSMDCLDLLAVQGTLKSLLQHHSSKHQSFGTQLSSEPNFHIHTWWLEKL